MDKLNGKSTCPGAQPLLYIHDQIDTPGRSGGRSVQLRQGALARDYIPDLPRIKAFPEGRRAEPGGPLLPPARGGLVLGLGEQELRIGGHIVALVGGNQFAALRLVRVLPIIKPLFQGLGDGFSLADFVLLEISCGRRQPSFLYDKRRLLPAAARTLGHFVPKYRYWRK